MKEYFDSLPLQTAFGAHLLTFRHHALRTPAHRSPAPHRCRLPSWWFPRAGRLVFREATSQFAGDLGREMI
jgi:hypothetical protein